MRYLVLFRGINVGGNNKVAMADLRKYASELGFCNVSTYINSGNLLLDSNASTSHINNAITSGFQERFGFPVRTVTIDADAFQHELVTLPNWWRADYARKYAMFYMDGFDFALAHSRVATYDLLEHEHIHMGSLALYWGVCDKSSINRSALKKHLMGEKFYADLTLRNSNTFEKLALLL